MFLEQILKYNTKIRKVGVSIYESFLVIGNQQKVDFGSFARFVVGKLCYNNIPPWTYCTYWCIL